MDTTERPVPYLTIKEVAGHYKVVPKSVYRWIAAGLAALNVGSESRPDYRLRLEDVEVFLRVTKRRGADDGC